MLKFFLVFLLITQSLVFSFNNFRIDGVRKKRSIDYLCEPGDVQPPNRVDTTQRLEELRNEMSSRNIAAYIVPLDEIGRRAWISGFSGSNGDSIITMEQAATWTDGRYFLQASEELDCNWQLMKMSQPGVPTYGQWLVGGANLSSGDIVAADPKLMGAQTWLDLQTELNEGQLVLMSLSDNLIDIIWTEDDGRPEYQPKDIVTHDLAYAGVSYTDKLINLRNDFQSKKIDAFVISELDEIAWFFNLRGEGDSSLGGLKVSPYFESLAVVSENEVHLWLETSKLTQDVIDHLNPESCSTNNACVQTSDISNAFDELQQWATNSNLKVGISKPSTYLIGANFAIYESIPQENVVFVDSYVLDSKAIKNPIEAQGMIDAHIRDAYACIEFFAFMEDQIVTQQSDDWDEINASEKLKELRESQLLNKGLSFTTIAASGKNGAVIHYTPQESTVAKINDTSVFLVDSGGQYLDGTTDITRTLHYGNPDEEVIEMYTRVLMGHIDLARAIVPLGTSDKAIDVLSRQHIFQNGLDFRHGTGHGIGAYLGVHEGPTQVAMSGKQNSLKENYFFSDEPGYYKDGEYGIRLESIVRTIKKNFQDTTYGEFIGFEMITLVPYEPKLIDFSLMNNQQIQWYNDYNKKIRDVVLPHFIQLNRLDIVDWIIAKTEPVTSDVI